MKTRSGSPQGVVSMEPMLPDTHDQRLAELSQRVFVGVGALRAALPCETARRGIAALVREMNSYYSNLIEGHKTLPRDIERALRDDFLPDARARLNQQLARAHIRVQEEMERRLAGNPDLDVHGREFLCWLHGAFYSQLPNDAREGCTESGRSYRVEAGTLRSFNVAVGAHTPPDYRMLDRFMDRFRQAYGDRGILATNRLAAVAAAHHRLAWIHPFGDGNGRVARLHSQAALIRMGVAAEGLWTLSRGLARSRNEYYTRLAAADRQRRDDYDGRGNLSARGLNEFCAFMLETMLDQVEFMGKLLDLSGLRRRIDDYVHRDSGIARHREQLVRLLLAAVTEGSLPRGRVAEIVGLKTSAARQVIALGLREGLLETASPKGPLRIAFPSKVLDAYFPRLFLDLPYGE